MAAMWFPAVPGWLTLAVSAAAGAWFLGSAAAHRRAGDLHHAAMAAAMVWMATMPRVSCHGAAGPVAGAVASYFLLAAAPFLTGPFRCAPRRAGATSGATLGSSGATLGSSGATLGSSGATLGSLGHAAMSLAMAGFLTAGLTAG
jgi:hypothetical protein